MNSLKKIVKGFLENRFVRRLAERKFKWSIGIYVGSSAVDFYSPKNISNPVLTSKDVTDISAEFVADPFMVLENGNWYMFFEVLNKSTAKGDIGLATSNDGFNWNYQKIVLDESFHLSYPYVFKWDNNYYMIPESCQAKSIRLYKAVNFPTDWELEKVLLDERDFADASIFYFDSRWWILTAASKGNTLFLYYSDELTGPWIEHPQSPVIKDDNRVARPAGRAIVLNDKIIRYTQDVRYIYGNKVRAFEINKLTTTHYQEKEIKGNPVIKASGIGWNKYGMHHIDPHQLNDREWIACVDGNQTFLVLNFLKTS
jgi:hypothetical protein